MCDFHDDLILDLKNKVDSLRKIIFMNIVFFQKEYLYKNKT